MILCFTLGIVLLALLASAQTTHTVPRSGAALLVLPRPGVPLSFEQIEESSRKFDDGASAVEVRKSKIYRDFAGRLRMEAGIREGSGHPSTPYTDFIDPVAGSRVILLSTETEKVGYRLPWPKSSEGGFGFCFAREQDPPSRKWTARTESIGARTIEGSGFDGTRIIQTAQGEPRLTKTIEEWYSADLKLIGLLLFSAPNETYAARIQNVRCEEPDPALFTVPPNYKVVDVPLPASDRQ